MKPSEIRVGLRVHWHDPAARDGPEYDTSGPGVITWFQEPDSDEDTDIVVAIKRDDGGEVEAFPHELTILGGNP